jgi:hypothetical protein
VVRIFIFTGERKLHLLLLLPPPIENREPAASRIDTSLRDTRHAAASWNVFTKSEIKWKQNGNKQPLSYAPGGGAQVAPKLICGLGSSLLSVFAPCHGHFKVKVLDLSKENPC